MLALDTFIMLVLSGAMLQAQCRGDIVQALLSDREDGR